MQRECPSHGGAAQPSLGADPGPQGTTLLNDPFVGLKDRLHRLVETVGVEGPGVAKVPAQVQADTVLSQQVLSSEDQTPDPGAVQLRPQVTVGDEPGRNLQIRCRSFGRGAFISSQKYLGRLSPVEAQGKDHPLYVGGCAGLDR